MLLGQLYYFEKKLSDIQAALMSGNLTQLEIAGIEAKDLSELTVFRGGDLKLKLVSLFSGKYTELLAENNLQNALKTWKLIVSPYKSTSVPLSNFHLYYTVSNWLNNTPQENLGSLVEEIGIVFDEEEFAILYGLKVLETLADKEVQTNHTNTLGTDTASFVVTGQEVQMLVICSAILSPFFVQLGCEYIDSGLAEDKILQLAMSAISQKDSINMVLIDSKNDVELISKMRKKVDSRIIIAPFQPNIKQDQGYFDSLVKQTLGVRLV